MNLQKYQFNYFIRITYAGELILRAKIAVCILLVSLCSHAQISQKGVTLEYNRRQAKTVYTMPVELKFEGASSTNNMVNGEYGSFILQFDRAHAGDTIKGYDVVIGNQEYILFNKDKIDNWNLSQQATMEVVVCPKDIVDYLEKTYTKNQINQLSKRYNKLKEELRKSVGDIEELRKQMIKLEREYKNEISYIKARAVLFAYVDETQIDSLENLRRECILSNDLERAAEIGEMMNLVGISNSTIENYRIAKGTHKYWVEKLEDLSTIIEDHIQNCLSVGEPEDSLVSYYRSLVDIYKELLGEYQDLKSKEVAYKTTKTKLGNLLYLIADRRYDESEEFIDYFKSNRDAIYIEAANLGNCNALWYLIRIGEKDFLQRKEYARQLLYLVEREGADPPEEDYEKMTLDYIRDSYESFPDFGIENKGNLMFFHIIKDNEVSLVHFEKTDTLEANVIVPQIVKYKGNKYTVTKIGQAAFAYEPKEICNHEYSTFKAVTSMYLSVLKDCNLFENISSNPLDFTNYPIDFYELSKIILPNTIRYLGTSAFGLGCRWTNLPAMNLPKSLKVIKADALSSVQIANDKNDNIITIPEGVEEFEDVVFSMDNESYSFIIPSTARKIMAFHAIYRKSPFVKIAKISPNNKHYILINDIMYTSDSTDVFIGTACSSRDYFFPDEDLPVKSKKLYIPRNLKTDFISVLSDCYSPTDLAYCIDSIYADSENPLYSIQDGILYDKGFKNIILKPKGVKTVVIPQTLEAIDLGYVDPFLGTERIEISKGTKADLVIDLLKSISDTIIVKYYDKENLITSQDDIIPYIETILDENPQENTLSYILGALYLNSYDVFSAHTLWVQTDWTDTLLCNKLEMLCAQDFSKLYSVQTELDESINNNDYKKQIKLYGELVKYWKVFAKDNDEDRILYLSRLHNWRGIAYRMVDEYANSQNEYEAAIQIIEKLYLDNPMEYADYVSEIYSNMAIGYNDQGITDEAIKLFEKSLSVNPKNKVALEGLGVIYLNNGDSSKAEKMLEEIINIDNEYQNSGYLKEQIESCKDGTTN